MTRPNVDQKTIAELTGVSRTTVTKVLNHDPHHRVSPATREHILKTAREMGYEPRRRRIGCLGFVVCGSLGETEICMHLSICEEAARCDYRVFLVNAQQKPTFRQIVKDVNPLTCDGVIIGGDMAPAMARQLGEILPVVTVGQFPERSGVDWIKADTRELGCQLVERIISFGHRDIALIVDDFVDFMDREMIDGYKCALQNADIPVDESLIFERGNRDYTNLIDTILSHPRRATALMNLEDNDHAVILALLREKGIKVPLEFSYAGWSTPAVKPFGLPETTCLGNIHQSIASAAIKRLLDRIDDRSLEPKEIFPAVAISRGETLDYRNGGGS